MNLPCSGASGASRRSERNHATRNLERISFGLVTIPVTLLPALQARGGAALVSSTSSLAPIHNKRVNETTGKEVAWEHVVKGFEVDEEELGVLVTEDDLRANVEATQTIDVLAAVCADEIHPGPVRHPVLLEPEKAGPQGVPAAARGPEDREESGARQDRHPHPPHLAAIVPDGDLLALEVLRYPYELRDVAEAQPAGERGQRDEGGGVTKAELSAGSIRRDHLEALRPCCAEYRDT